MSAPLFHFVQLHSAQQVIAAFALHAAWQAPLLVLAAWVAVRVGRPRVGAAHALWLVTLVLCVAAPALSTWAGRSAALAAEHATVTTISYVDGIDPNTLPELKRPPAWQRLLNQHLTLQHGVEPFALVLPQRWAAVIACVWLAIALLCALRLMLALRHTWVLVHRASAQDVSPAIHAELQRQCDALGIAAPRVAVSSGLRGPALAGTLQPTLLLPKDVAAMTPAEVEAVLAHELAHLRRGDPLLHTLCALLLVPVGFHPAAWWAARRVRQTREIACDAEAAAHMGSHVNYARALLRVAERIAGAPAKSAERTGLTGLGLFGGLNLLGLGVELFDKTGALEERMAMVMQENAVERRGVRAARAGAAVVVGAVAVLAAAMVQVQPALASEQSPQQVTVVAATPQVQQPLLAGERARQQLNQASRQLDEAAQKASTDDDRRKIATAQQVVRSAQHELAAADVAAPQVDVKNLSNLNVNIDLQKLNADLKNLHVVLQNMPEVKGLDLKALNLNDLDLSAAKALANGDRMIVLHPKVDAQQLQAQVDAARKAAMESREAAIKAAKQASAEQVRAAVEAARAEAEIRAARAKVEAAQAVARMEMPVIPALQAVPAAAADAGQQAADKPAKIASGVMAGNKIGGSTPIYPQDAKDKHVSGAVVLHAIIDRTGSIAQLTVVSGPEMLRSSAVSAVQDWKYKPYLLNGNPTEVDTTITVNFSFGG